MADKHFQVAIVGAGPAGMSAAIAMTKAGLSNIVIDDQKGCGGQVYRNLQDNKSLTPNYLGESYYTGLDLYKAFTDCRTVYRPNCTVWQITENHEIAIVWNGKAELITADYIILATGAIERAMPVQGWTLPGVMSVGGAQTLLKQAALGANDAIFVGAGPLLYLTAWQYIEAGLTVRAVIDTTQKINWLSALPFTPLALLQPKMLAMGLKWLHKIKAKTTVIKNVKKVEIIGKEAVEALSYTTKSGKKIQISTKTVYLHQGVVPNVNLSMATGLDHKWDKRAHCWRPVTDKTGKTSDERIYIAGDGSGIGGAEAAAISGKLAASTIAMRFGKVGSLSQLFYKFQHVYSLSIRPFLDRLYLPPAQFRVPQNDSAIICRCEAVNKADINAALASGATGPNQLKAFSRAGMGRCQGRNCGLIVQEMIAAHTGQSMAETGYYRLRPPVKPITLAELASLDGPWPQ